MDDTRCREFFARPIQPYHRQYEALRAVFLEGHSQQEVADRFGYTYSSLRQLVHGFRQHGDQASASAPFFASCESDGPRQPSPRHSNQKLHKRKLPM